MSPLGLALRRRFKSPREAMEALQLDPSLINIKRLSGHMAFDAATGGSAKAELEKILAGILDGAEFQRAQELLHSIEAGDDDRGERYAEAIDEETDEEARREQRRGMMTKVADFLATEKGYDEKEITDFLSDFPKTGLEHLGGALAEDLEKVMKDRRGPAGDARRRRAHDAQLASDAGAFVRAFPEVARIENAPGFGDCATPSRMATDADSSSYFYELFPEARRIIG